MSLYSSRYSNASYSYNSSPRMSVTQSPFSRSKQLGQIFLDKKTIIKRMQRLMLDVKDLDTKMFISKTISYLDQNLCNSEQPFRTVDTNQQEEKQNCHKKTQSLLFSNNCSEVKPFENNSTMELSLTIPTHLQSHLQIVNQSKFMSDTAASEGFFNTRRESKQVPPQVNEVIEQTVSQAGTVQCECGLFEGLLRMVSKLMQIGIIRNRQQQNQTDCLQIDQVFIRQITQEIIQQWKSVLNKQQQHKSQMINVTQQLVKRQAEALQVNAHIDRLTQQLQQLHYQVQDQKVQCVEWQQQYIKLRQSKIDLDQKLSVCSKQLEKANLTRSLFEDSKNIEIQALKLQIQLKDSEISNMETIIQSLQKTTKQYDSQLQSMKKIQQPNSQNVSITLNYALNLKLQSEKTNSPAKAISKSNLQKQNIFQRQNQLKHLQIQNDQLKQECLLLHERLTQKQLFGNYKKATGKY